MAKLTELRCEKAKRKVSRALTTRAAIAFNPDAPLGFDRGSAFTRCRQVADAEHG